MTNFDPGGFLMLLTVIPSLVAGAVSISLAHLLDWVGYGEYESNVVGLLGILILGWIGTALFISTGMLRIITVVLAMIGAYAATRNIAAASYGWVLGVVLMFVVFIALSNLGIYRGVDAAGRPRGFISRHLGLFYAGGLLGFGALAGKGAALVMR